jgi:hypothetical protein
MRRVLLSAVLLGLLATPAPAGADCGRIYVVFLERVASRVATMSAEKLVVIHRRALRLFDACDVGHVTDVDWRFAELERLAQSES